MPRHTARAIVMHADRLLLIERWRDDLHYFSIPGGEIEPGETPEAAAMRELQEETGCVVRVEHKLYILRLKDGTEHHLFKGEYISGEPHLSVGAPELGYGPNNRFVPRWLPIEQLADAPFLVWQPIKEQLLHDLRYGFPETLQTLA